MTANLQSLKLKQKIDLYVDFTDLLQKFLKKSEMKSSVWYTTLKNSTYFKLFGIQCLVKTTQPTLEPK